MILRLFCAAAASCLLFSCGGLPANRAVDRFVWERLEADRDASEAVRMGTTDCAAFLAEMSRFPWREQAKLADRFQLVSPTLSVTDLLSDRTFFISSAVGSDDSLGYFVGYLYPVGENGAGQPRRADMYLQEEMDAIRELVVLFFARDDEALGRRLSQYGIWRRTEERISWKEYLKEKQAYL